ncbi:MAG: hypothetical protein GC171_02240 [Terrimonas sp.]|nr:hypothetical protein [Terrimonas sp.]
MTDPLTFLNGIAEKEFYTNLKARRQEYFSVLEKFYDEVWTRGNITHFGRLLEEQHIYAEYVGNRTITSDGNYTVECYEERQRLFLKQIKEQAFKDLDNDKTEVYIQLMSKILKQLIKSIQLIDLAKDLNPYREKVIAKLQTCITHLNDTFIQSPISKSNNTPKIQWLGKTNVLATLFYDLWQGQEKGKNNKTKPLLKTQKNELEALLLNNFIDVRGEPLTINTISDYLNSSKPEKRAKVGVRIELGY